MRYLCRPLNAGLVDVLAPYRIPFVGLKPGRHVYRMEVDPLFFASFPQSEIHSARGVAEIVLEKIGSTLDAVVVLDAVVTLPCDRCLADAELPIHFEDRVIAHTGAAVTDLDGEVLQLGPEVYELDLAQPIFEAAHFALPTRRVHAAEEDCDPDVAGYLAEGTGEEGDEDEGPDPRWSALNDLKSR
jgi:uncharacterized metal-binding protein YceD (DUF177 family)